MKQCYFFLFLILFMSSCKGPTKTTKPLPKKNRIAFSQEHKKLELFENYASKIDANQKLVKIESLFYTDSDGNTCSAFAWLDADLNIVKLSQEENYTNGKKIEQTFYFLDGLKTISNQLVSHFERKKPVFFETRTYYNTNGGAVATFGCKSIATYQQSASFKEQEKSTCSHEKALQMIRRKGDFETRFLGFDQAYDRRFIVLGSEKQSTTVAFNVESPVIKKLLTNEKKFMNTPMEVEFINISEPDGFTFQALIDLHFAK